MTKSILTQMIRWAELAPEQFMGNSITNRAYTSPIPTEAEIAANQMLSFEDNLGSEPPANFHYTKLLKLLPE